MMKKLIALLIVAGSPALAASGPFFSLRNTDFVVTIAFLLFVGVLAYFKVPALVGNLLDKRAAGIQADLNEAKALREEALRGFATSPKTMSPKFFYDHRGSQLFELICHRYERRSLLVTSNQPFREWDEIFPSGSMTVAAVDRLVHHCHIVGIKGESYRQKALAKSLLGVAPGAAEVLETIRYLLQSRYITGRVLSLDGGRHLRLP